MTIDVPAPVEEVVESLRQHVEPGGWISFSHGNAPFRGEVHDQGFEVYSNLHYRNTCAPVLYGTYESQQSGTAVHVRIRLPPFNIALLCVLFGVWMLLAAVGVFVLVRDGEVMFLVVCAVTGLLSVLLALGLFWHEVPSAKRLLRDALPK